MVNSSIYGIFCKQNGRVYIGSSVNIKNRFITHKSLLKSEKHHCQPLQDDWNQYGEEGFTFQIIEQVPSEQSQEAEKQWSLHYGTKIYNNLEGYGGSRPGAGRKMVGKTPTQKCTITISDKMTQYLIELGKGNLSRGIRIAAEYYQEKKQDNQE